MMVIIAITLVIGVGAGYVIGYSLALTSDLKEEERDEFIDSLLGKK